MEQKTKRTTEFLSPTTQPLRDGGVLRSQLHGQGYSTGSKHLGDRNTV